MAGFLDTLDRDGLGVDPLGAMRLHPEMLDAAEFVLENDLRRIRYAGAPPPLGTLNADGAEEDRASTPSEPDSPVSPASADTDADPFVDDDEDDGTPPPELTAAAPGATEAPAPP